MNRLTIDRIKAAYKRTTLVPITGSYGECLPEGHAACPATAVAVAEGAAPFHDLYYNEEPDLIICDKLDLSPRYLDAFMIAVDHNSSPNKLYSSDPDYRAGLEDGAAILLAMPELVERAHKA
jgi:hypothetical protein